MIRRRLHPQPLAAPDTMCEDELRYYIHEFLYNPAFGWSNSKLALARFFGIDLHGLKSKVRQGRTQSWFLGGERIRFTRQIRRLLAGEVIPRQARAASGQLRWEAVLADHPQPVRLPSRFRYNLGTGRIELVQPVASSYSPAMLSFATGLKRGLALVGAAGDDKDLT